MRRPASGRCAGTSSASAAAAIGGRLRHAALAGLVALRHLARFRADEAHSVALQGGAVAPRRRMRPHLRVHGGRQKHGPVGGEQNGRGEIVGKSVGELGHQVGGGRRHQHQVGLAGQPDVADILFVLTVEEIGEHVIGGKRADRQRRHELLGRVRHHGTDGGAALAQPTDQVERLIGRDAAADDQKDALSGKGHAAWYSHGLMTLTPHSSKSRTLRVARDAPCVEAIAAICASSSRMGLPKRRRSAAIRAKACASAKPNGRT